MKKHLWKILNVILILYFSFEFLKKYHPKLYGTSFNKERIEIGLVPIDSSLIRKGKDTYVYQTWINKSSEVPRFYAKYACFDKWNRGIEMENDNYVVLVDSSKVILSINYNFGTEKFNYSLKKFNRPKNTSDLYGHSGKTIRELSENETEKILNKNGIKY